MGNVKAIENVRNFHDNSNAELRAVSEKDSELLFRWANDPEVRNNSFNSDPILWEDHTAWFSKKLSDEDTKMYILYDNNIPVGQVRCALSENACAEIGYSVGSAFRGHGYGTYLLSLLYAHISAETNWEKLIGKVKKENIASQKAFEKAGYEKTELEEFIQYTKEIAR